MTALSADRPSIDPKDDLFGHAPFASSLADSICRYPGSDGLVLALYGPWGSGKSTVLSYVQHFLERRPESEQRSEEHTSELQSRPHLVCRLLLEKKKKQIL